MKVVIIEDEAPAFRRLQKILDEVDPTIEIVEVLDSVKGTIDWLGENEEPDLFFMDIQLSDGLSFEIFDQRKTSKPIIFTTAFDEYMLNAFKVNSIDYLLKPIKKESLESSLNKYHEMKMVFSDSRFDIGELVKTINFKEKNYKSRFLVKRGSKLITVDTSSIAFFQAQQGLVFLKTKEDQKYYLDLTLDEISAQLDPECYFRVNRQFIISIDIITEVRKIDHGKLEVIVNPSTNEEIIVSSEKSPIFKDWLGR